MAKIDRIKEVLNTLRVAMSIAFGILVLLVGSIIKRYDANNIDIIFWLGVVLTFVILFIIVTVVLKISAKTKEIEGL
ncbi:MAG: hypothetical protein DRG24_05715 [Epsilonproteobacteria bacterium]|nr:MAG: hypothetical protein DRG24_05715 [Campylobacterota bacterium]